MPLPGPVDYMEVLQSPKHCFQDQELGQCKAEIKGRIPIPHIVTGNFAVVCRLSKGRKSWAVRCFYKREVADQRQHYQDISDYLESQKLPEFVNFQYLKRGIQVKQKWHPIIKMEWVEGVTLSAFIKQHLQKPQALKGLAELFRMLTIKMQKHGIAHGDLQHGNIIVTKDSKIRLVDYDGMFVPTTKRNQCPEVGHYNYQHPRRTGADYDRNLDNFSSLVIYLSLLAIAHEPQLWDEFNNGENLIFSQKDFKSPSHSKLFKKLKKSSFDGVKGLAKSLEKCCQGAISGVPDLETLAKGASIPTPQPTKTDPYWWKDPVIGAPQPKSRPRSTSKPPPPTHSKAPASTSAQPRSAPPTTLPGWTKPAHAAVVLPKPTPPRHPSLMMDISKAVKQTIITSTIISLCTGLIVFITFGSFSMIIPLMIIMGLSIICLLQYSIGHFNKYGVNRDTKVNIAIIFLIIPIAFIAIVTVVNFNQQQAVKHEKESRQRILREQQEVQRRKRQEEAKRQEQARRQKEQQEKRRKEALRREREAQQERERQERLQRQEEERRRLQNQQERQRQEQQRRLSERQRRLRAQQRRQRERQPVPRSYRPEQRLRPQPKRPSNIPLPKEGW